MAGFLGLTEQMRKVFNKFDKNGDGKISRDELKSVLTSLGTVTTSDELDRMMSEMDKDGNGYVDLDEFIAYQETNIDGDGDGDGGNGRNGQCERNKELKEAFDMYDLDKNGLISASELHAVLKRLGEKCSFSDCKRMINQVDKDGDGNVNFEEFKKMMANPSS